MLAMPLVEILEQKAERLLKPQGKILARATEHMEYVLQQKNSAVHPGSQQNFKF